MQLTVPSESFVRISREHSIKYPPGMLISARWCSSSFSSWC